jgi:hypothetical protein
VFLIVSNCTGDMPRVSSLSTVRSTLVAADAVCPGVVMPLFQFAVEYVECAEVSADWLAQFERGEVRKHLTLPDVTAVVASKTSRTKPFHAGGQLADATLVRHNPAEQPVGSRLRPPSRRSRPSRQSTAAAEE